MSAGCPHNQARFCVDMIYLVGYKVSTYNRSLKTWPIDKNPAHDSKWPMSDELSASLMFQTDEILVALADEGIDL